MNTGDLVLPLAILIWAAFEYHRREQDHKEAMSYLQRGIEPPTQPDTPKTLHLWTVGTTAVLLFALSIGLLWYAMSGPVLYGSGALVMLAFPFAGMAILLLLILRRDLKRWKHSSR